ncbi:hypothetical protein ROZALSC1DRAFT_26620 [Rozella allomycis CSF55]|nr:hypothetical protein O9G_001387 [Rozella allomycis CSF55]RKP21999.1 hypothetical protein ROZALSC1DRAFT_26620 [Rozella allomycis CSF55]|eukprot:EPZ36942.1 hypothetical protein O9G_001387 [Rozella allomycis CSF55]
MDKSEISVCDKKTLKSQLVYFKRIYPEVVMKFNNDYGEEHMRTYLCSLIDKRAAEETLWRIME